MQATNIFNREGDIKMKDYRPNGCKMYVAIRDIDFLSFDSHDEGLHIAKGDVWMLKQITFNDRIWLNKQYESEAILQITQEQLESDFVEVNLKDVNMDTVYDFKDDDCTETVMLNGYAVSTNTFSWSFDDFCEQMGYPLSDWIH